MSADNETPYMDWPTAEKLLNIGGHDLLCELKGSIGKFLRMEITFDR